MRVEEFPSPGGTRMVKSSTVRPKVFFGELDPAVKVKMRRPTKFSDPLPSQPPLRSPSALAVTLSAAAESATGEGESLDSYSLPEPSACGSGATAAGETATVIDSHAARACERGPSSHYHASSAAHSACVGIPA
eukprot:2063550-Pleurochrysis_carterae.AAC.1